MWGICLSVWQISLTFLFFYVSLFSLFSLADPLPVLSSHFKYATLNEAFEVTCTLMGVKEMSLKTIVFNRNGSVFYPGSLLQKTHSCKVIKQIPGYSVSCGSGTDNNQSMKKKYHLRIERIKQDDITVWSCSVDDIQSNNYTIYHACMFFTSFCYKIYQLFYTCMLADIDKQTYIHELIPTNCHA